MSVLIAVTQVRCDPSANRQRERETLHIWPGVLPPVYLGGYTDLNGADILSRSTSRYCPDLLHHPDPVRLQIPATSFGWRTLFCLPNRSDALLLNCGSADLGSDTLLLSSEQSSPDVFGDQNAFMRSLSRPKGIQQQPTDIRIIPDIRTRYDTGSDNDSLSSSAGSEDMQHQ